MLDNFGTYNPVLEKNVSSKNLRKADSEEQGFKLGIDNYTDEELEQMPYFGQLGIGRDVRKAAANAGMLQKVKFRLEDGLRKAEEAEDNGLVKEITDLIDSLDGYTLLQLQGLDKELKQGLYGNTSDDPFLEIAKFLTSLNIDRNRDKLDEITGLGDEGGIEKDATKKVDKIEKDLKTSDKNGIFNLLAMAGSLLSQLTTHLDEATNKAKPQNPLQQNLTQNGMQPGGGINNNVADTKLPQQVI